MKEAVLHDKAHQAFTAPGVLGDRDLALALDEVLVELLSTARQRRAA